MRANPEFGKFFKSRRMEAGMTLREFCRRHGFDAGNISKIERGLLPPPQSDEIKRKYAAALGIKEGTDDWLTFFDLAAACSGSLPADIASDEEVVRSLPVVFRLMRGSKTDEEALRGLIETIRKELR